MESANESGSAQDRPGLSATIPGMAGKLAKMALFSLFWCGITAVFVFFAVGSLVQQRDAAKRFVATRGVVIASRVKTHPGDGDSGPTYEAKVKYSYEVRGHQYTSRRYAYAMPSSSDPSQAERIVADYPPGKTIDLWYDPQDPGESVLQLRTPILNYFMLLFMQPFIVIGLGLIAYTVWIPIAHARAQRFIDQPEGLLGDIPGWGSAGQDVRGLKIESGRNPLSVLYAFVAGYGVTCFLSIFVIAFLLRDLAEGSNTAVFNAFYIAMAIGVAAMLVTLIRPAKKAVLTIDTTLARLTLTSPRRDVSLPFDQIDSWAVRTIADPNGMMVNDVPLTRPLLSVRTSDGQSQDIHVFGTGDEMAFVARKVGNALAGLTGSSLVEEAPERLPEEHKPLTKLADLIKQMKRLGWLGLNRKGDYRDIMP